MPVVDLNDNLECRGTFRGAVRRTPKIEQDTPQLGAAFSVSRHTVVAKPKVGKSMNTAERGCWRAMIPLTRSRALCNEGSNAHRRAWLAEFRQVSEATCGREGAHLEPLSPLRRGNETGRKPMAVPVR
jgi:hypothetical protein